MAAQFILLAVGGTAMQSGVAIPFLLLALLLPIRGYVWALSDAPILAKLHHRVFHSVILWLASLVFSLLVFFFGLGLFVTHHHGKDL
jgi:ABC-type arginine transport system permease subunit